MGRQSRTRSSSQARSIVTILTTLGLVGSIAAPSAAYRRPYVVERVSIATDGSEAANTRSLLERSVVSSSGRLVGFASDAPNLVPGDTNALSDVFIRDRRTNSTAMVSLGVSGSVAVGLNPDATWQTTLSWGPAFARGNRLVAFSSFASNLVAGDTNGSSDIFIRDLRTGNTERVSLAEDGSEVNGNSYATAVSANGRFVAFESEGTNISSLDPQPDLDIYVHDRKTGETQLVSVRVEADVTVSPLGALTGQGQLPSFCPSLSADGRYVSFHSARENLVPDDDNPGWDTFVRDLRKDLTERVSIPTGGGPSSTVLESGSIISSCAGLPRSDFGGGGISSDGRFVVFRSLDTNLIPHDLNRSADVFVHDRETGRTQRISVDRTGGEADDASDEGFITPDGRYVGFTTWSSNLDPAEPPPTRLHWCQAPQGRCQFSSAPDIYLHDRLSGATQLVSLTTDGTSSDPAEEGSLDNSFLGTRGSFAPALDDGARFISFFSELPDFTEDDNNAATNRFGGGDIFLHHRGADVATNSLRSSGRSTQLWKQDSLHDLGRLLTERGANLYGASLTYRPQYSDLFAAIELEHMPKVVPGASPIFYGLRLEVEGKSYEVRATSLNFGTFGLFDCSSKRPACMKVADLRGGYGTTGMRAVFSLPLEEVGLEDGGELKDVVAFSGLGSYLTGPTKVLDTVRLK